MKNREKREKKTIREFALQKDYFPSSPISPSTTFSTEIPLCFLPSPNWHLRRSSSFGSFSLSNGN
jgi:hypothetical protein